MPFKLVTNKVYGNKVVDNRVAMQVFERIDMHGGDTSVCWEWNGYVAHEPQVRIGNKRFSVKKIVWGLKHGVSYDKIPRLRYLCGNIRCCNPNHIMQFRGIARHTVDTNTGMAKTRARLDEMSRRLEDDAG